MIALLMGLAMDSQITQTVYEGTIGKAPIVLEVRSLDQDKALTAGRYFYRKYRVHIPFRAEGNNRFAELPSDCDYDLEQCTPTAHLSLKPSGEGLSGAWTRAGDGKQPPVPVALKVVSRRTITTPQTPVDLSSLFPETSADQDHDAPMLDDPFLSRQLMGNTTYGPETRVGHVAYQTATDVQSGIHYIHLTAAPTPQVLNRMNRRLDETRLEMVSWGLDCKAQTSTDNAAIGTWGDWDSYDSNVVYVTDTIMVIQESGSTFCGGAYPNNSLSYRTYDLLRGEPFDMNRVLNLTTGAGDTAVNTPAYKALLAKLTPKSPWFLGAADDECLSEDIEQNWDLTFNAKGLVFALSDLPHVMGVCMGDYYVVPWHDLKALWTPQAKTYFPQSR